MSESAAPMLKGKLTLVQIVIIGVAYMSLGTSLSTYGLVAEKTHGTVSGAYVIALLAVMFTASSYSAMARAYPQAGSTYTYTSKLLGLNMGFMVGWAILLDYFLTLVINAVIFGAFMTAAVPAVPHEAWIVILALTSATVALVGARQSVRVTALLLVTQVVFVAIFVALCVKGIVGRDGYTGLMSVAPFFHAGSQLSFMFSALPILFVTFLGFDLVTAMSEETRDPKKTIPRAIMAIVFIGGFFAILLSYLIYQFHPDYTSFKNPDAAGYDLAVEMGGALFGNLLVVVLVASAAFASSVATYSGASRILYAMGRDGLLPRRVFGHLSLKFNTPTFNIVLLALGSLVAMFMDLEMAASFLTFGALFAFSFVNLSVIARFCARRTQRGIYGMVRYLLVPLAGCACTLGIMLFQLSHHAQLLGGLWLAIGFAYLLILTRMFTLPTPTLEL